MAVYAVPAVITSLMAAVAFWPNKPPVPPAPSADKVNISFLQGLLKVLTNISFWVLLVVWGCGAGIFNALVTLLAQMLCPFGYSDVSMIIVHRTAGNILAAMKLKCMDTTKISVVQGCYNENLSYESIMTRNFPDINIVHLVISTS
jgi:hypothetical protein